MRYPPLKYIFFLLISSFLIGFLLITPLYAATTLSLSAREIYVQPGATFIVRIVLSPQDVKNYTAKISISFPIDFLKVDEFIFSDNWVPLYQSGYDLLDNEKGVLIKTASYPAGIENSSVFGTIIFHAREEGEGVIRIEDDSITYDSTDNNTLSGLPIEILVQSSSQFSSDTFSYFIPHRIPSGFLFDENLTHPLVFGKKNIDVAYLQVCLKNQFNIYRGPPFGNFNEETREAVKEFQDRYLEGSLFPDVFSKKAAPGFMDEETRVKLNEVCRQQENGGPVVLFDIISEPIIDLEQETKSSLPTALGIVLFSGFAFGFYYLLKKRGG